MSYTPGAVPADASDLSGFLNNELQALARNSTDQKPYLFLQTLNVAPTKPREGMIVKADGTNWNPGSGPGVYVYKSGAWYCFDEFLQAGTGAIPRTSQEKNREVVSVLDYFANGTNGAEVDPTGAIGSGGGFQAAINQADILIPTGTYLIDQDLVIPDNRIITAQQGAVLKASANGRIFFKSTTHAYFSRIFNVAVDGNGKTGVIFADMTNMRFQSGAYNCLAQNVAAGFIARTGCFGSRLQDFTTINCPAPVQILANSSDFLVDNPNFDNTATFGGSLAGVGVAIAAGASDNIGVRVTGGYIQGFANGATDSGLATVVDSVYFEQCSTADISASNGRGARYSDCRHYGPSGASGYKLRNCDAMTIFNPQMASGGRTALYDIDSTNTNCYEYRPPSNASLNSPAGTLTYLGTLARQDIGTFTPVIAGSGTAGAGTYTVQSAKWSRTGNVVHFDLTVTWTAHTGTGNITITGLPAALAPASYTPSRAFLATVSGLAFTGPILYASFSGTGTTLNLLQITAAGVLSLVPIAASGTLNITGSFES